jgi:hypothetical protein
VDQLGALVQLATLQTQIVHRGIVVGQAELEALGIWALPRVMVVAEPMAQVARMVERLRLRQ